ncbi:MAG: FAD-binding oxidoreductase [Candidatus Paceibacterota bacterium]|jgi:FAD/FMN-containing dehydrogenase
MNSIDALKTHLAGTFKGEFDDSTKTLVKYSHDASLCEVVPKIVVFPKDSEDIQELVRFVSNHKSDYPDLSVTVRAAGSCMSGGPLNDSIIVDIMRHMHGTKSVSMTADGGEAVVLPGTFYRDFEVETLKRGLILPCYTASKNLNSIGGMVGNNSAGEKTLRYGKTERYVKELRVVFGDGCEYVVRPLSRFELDAKIAQGDFEGRLYGKIWDIVSNNAKLLADAKPKVSKNSAGYYLWNVWDGKTFDLTRLIVGSQGTLGIVTEVRLRLVPIKPISKLFVVFMPTLDRLGDVVNDILPLNPESLESYDDSTMMLAVKFLPSLLKKLRHHLIRLLWSFLPEAWMAITGGMPKLVLLVEFCGDTNEEVDSSIIALEQKLEPYKFKMRRAKNEFDSEKYWTIRRESFSLLREHVHGSRTAPFVDDVVVPPHAMPDFLPKMRAILDEYKLVYTIAGHAGNGNFHIIPFMNMKDDRNLRVIDEVSDRVYSLVLSYGGSITGEHNDGIIRTPYLPQMYGAEVMRLFKATKDAFDAQNIFNPGKKVGDTKEFMMSHLARL